VAVTAEVTPLQTASSEKSCLVSGAQSGAIVPKGLRFLAAQNFCWLPSI
jgi:hypothetical protein